MDDQTETEILRIALRILGRRRSERKAQAARANGRKGGRPPGIPASAETRAKISATKRRQRLQSEATFTSEGGSSDPAKA